MKNTLALVFIVLLSGCTNHLYSGTTSYEFNGKTCHSIVYWNDLTHLFDQDGKATTVIIKAPKGRSYSLTPPNDNSVDGSYELILPTGDFADEFADSDDITRYKTNDNEVFCGLFKGKEAHQKANVRQTEFTLYCKKNVRPIRKSIDRMQPSKQPYIFAMNEPVEAFSWFKSREIKADISVVKCE
nr:hypothetical protein [uncultured Glaciecola sp.]